MNDTPQEVTLAEPTISDKAYRVIIEGVDPEVNGGSYPIKRVLGERVSVEADVFAAGHDVLSVLLKSRHQDEAAWHEVPMVPLGNDRWRGEFMVAQLGTYRYTVEGWIDYYKTWRSDLRKRVDAGQDVTVDLTIGRQLIEAAAKRAAGEDAARLRQWARDVAREDLPLEKRTSIALDDEMASLAGRYPDRTHASIYAPELRVTVDPVLARTGSWYELFPRSCPNKAGKHGTFRDLEAYLPRIAEMGFDVLYLPPIHPIGTKFRKGKNNNPTAAPDEPGSPWGIGSSEGGHTSIHPELGSLEDFKRVLSKATELKIEVAMDIAFQCSPDHPWVKEHPSWFKHRPDGSIQYAENPPKKYQDIYPINFETEDWKDLWRGLRAVIEYWINQGVRVFRVDNPHTKTLPFWEWAIAGIRQARPEVIFLSEAFTRPRVMYALAKLGFNQSYNYFPWRNTKAELTDYLTELSRGPVKEYFRANLWPNTPDILPYSLQGAGRPAFMTRIILAATLGSSYGVYGPAYELMENRPLKPGAEEYLDSEKYEIRDWNLDQPGNLAWLLSRVNHIRKQNPALHEVRNLVFHPTDNDMLIAYSKATHDYRNVILVFVNLDPHNVQSGWSYLDMEKLGLDHSVPYVVQDLLTDARFQWHGNRNYISLRPHEMPAHIFEIRR